MNEQTLRAYADLRGYKLMFNGAQRFVYAGKVVEHWEAGAQAEMALKLAAEEMKS